MKKSSSSTLLLTLAFAFACAGTAGLSVSAADSKTPATKSKKSGKAEPQKVVASDDKRPPLKISVDRKPINRDAPDRVSYAPIVKRTAASVVYVYSTKTIRGRDMTPFFNDPMLRRFFDMGVG